MAPVQGAWRVVFSRTWDLRRLRDTRTSRSHCPSWGSVQDGVVFAAKISGQFRWHPTFVRISEASLRTHRKNWCSCLVYAPKLLSSLHHLVVLRTRCVPHPPM